MKILQVIPHCDHESSGPTYYFINLCHALTNAGADVEACSLSSNRFPSQDFRSLVFPQSRFPFSRLGRSPQLAAYLERHIPNVDIVHNNSLWVMPNVYPGRIVSTLRGKGLKSPKLVTSPHGTLAAWALKHSAWKKKLIGWCGQNEALGHVARDMREGL